MSVASETLGHASEAEVMAAPKTAAKRNEWCVGTAGLVAQNALVRQVFL